MQGCARLRGSMPGRMWVAGLLFSVATGCSVDEPTAVRPLAAERPLRSQSASEGADALTRWETLGDDSLWKHVEASGGVVDVGLRQPGQAAGLRRGRVLVNAAHRAAGRGAIAAIPGTEVLSVDTLLPIVTLRLRDRAALARLRKLPHVEYVEPGFFTPVNGRNFSFAELASGCGTGGYAGPRDEYYVAPYDLVPWNYRRMKIDSAWAWASGRGVTVGLVDTGVDSDQPQFNEYFATGWSSGRTFEKFATDRSTDTRIWHDDCGHGTRMASVVGAPRNGGGTLGVAWGANLVAVRVDNDVILNQVAATREGIRLAATKARIVTLAFGTWAHYSSIAQELEYWYFNTDRIMLAAAGTYPCFDWLKPVSFPGTLQTVWTVAAFDETGGLACNSGRGHDVDFAAFTNQPVHGLWRDAPTYTYTGISGSSGATAVMAGLAALYLERNPGASRDRVQAALIAAASPTGWRSPYYGYGVPDAVCLMGVLCAAWVEGPTLIQASGNYTWTIRHSGGSGPFTYQWDTGSKSNSISRYVSVYPGMSEYLLTLTATVRDAQSGRTFTMQVPVVVRDPYGCPTCA